MAELAAAARAETRATTDQDSLGRTVPVRVLGRALGVEQPEDLEALAAAVPIAAAGYLTGAPSEPVLEAAVTTLRRILGPGTDEAVAAPIGLLLQAYEATATLVETALALGVNAREALRLKPPVAALRRVTPGGEIIEVDITAAPFSSGRRPCPGEAQAMAIATGIIAEAP
jgi:hypothetical protein